MCEILHILIKPAETLKKITRTPLKHLHGSEEEAKNLPWEPPQRWIC
jgi:hypothetical protein